MRIDPRGLRLFLAVCREGTISGAARAQHLSQPSVSTPLWMKPVDTIEVEIGPMGKLRNIIVEEP